MQGVAAAAVLLVPPEMSGALLPSGSTIEATKAAEEGEATDEGEAREEGEARVEGEAREETGELAEWPELGAPPPKYDSCFGANCRSRGGDGAEMRCTR